VKHIFYLSLILIFSFAGALQVQALSEQELTEQERLDFEQNWKPLEVTGGAVPWSIFAATKSFEVCKTEKDGYDACYLKPVYGDDVRNLDGTTVTIMGYMFPLEQTEDQKNFLIGPYPLSCPYHYHIGPENVIEVIAPKGIAFSFDPITIRGTLSVRYEQETGVFYFLENATVL
jgi:hypothetical protein